MSGFSTIAAANDFAERGLRLAQRLAAELGSGYLISYYDNRAGSIIQL